MPRFLMAFSICAFEGSRHACPRMLGWVQSHVLRPCDSYVATELVWSPILLPLYCVMCQFQVRLGCGLARHSRVSRVVGPMKHILMDFTNLLQ